MYIPQGANQPTCLSLVTHISHESWWVR